MTERGSRPPRGSHPPPSPGERDAKRAAHLGRERGPLGWFPKNSVAANVIMAVLIAGGLLMVLSGTIKQEVFPEVDLDMIVIQIPYPGASPEEVEQGVVLATEEEVRGLDGVKEVRGTAVEGMGVVTVELLLGTNADRALSDVKSAVDRITSYPEDTERPVVSLATNRQQVISLVLYGDKSEHELRALAERFRDDLLQDERITQADLSGVRPPEISIEVPQEELRERGLTLDRIAGIVRQGSVDLPAGEVETKGGDVLLRTKERKERGSEYEDIVLVSKPDGTEVTVGDIASVEDGFREVDRAAYYDGQRAVMLNVYRVGDETPIEVSEAVHQYVDEHQDEVPPGVKMATWADSAEVYADRVELLLRNAAIGFVLVLITLGAFLEIRLAFWVTLGIPISFLGGLLFMPFGDVTLNMISLFAFILTLGMVVDDAIVVGEAVYRYRQEGYSRIKASIMGVREVATPVIFSILTTCVAFAPMLFVPGVMGKFFRIIPIVVILVLMMSLVESLLVLPAHLAHSGEPKGKGAGSWLHHQQQRLSRGIERFIDRVYAPFLRRALQWRYLTIATGVALLVMSIGLVAGGRVQFTFMPKIESDVVVASVEMPVGTPAEQTRRVQQQIEAEARSQLSRLGDGTADVRGIFSELGASGGFGGGPEGGQQDEGSHLARVMVYLVPSDKRPFKASDLANDWRSSLEDIPGVERLEFDYSTASSGGKPIAVRLSHADHETLERAAADLASRIEEYDGVIDVDDGFRRGKQQLDVKLTEEGRAMGLSASELARQLRARFFGAEAKRLQRGRDELRVYVRLPREDRETLHTVERMILQTPQGGEIPLGRAADVTRGRAYTEITRTDGRRTLDVTGDVVPGEANAGEVMSDLEKDALPDLMADYPGLSWQKAGQQQERADAMGALWSGFGFAMIVMLCMLAVVFRSYIQPVIVMTAIPFGMVGAMVGHIVMGYDLSLMSMMGIVALAGVVVNASLILVVAINEFRTWPECSLIDAVVMGGQRRFRPILLTSLTTFLGLMPMILETSVQARFLIPMAISLGFGVLFATVITLVFVPAIYVIVEDVRRGGRKIVDLYRSPEPHPAE